MYPVKSASKEWLQVECANTLPTFSAMYVASTVPDHEKNGILKQTLPFVMHTKPILVFPLETLTRIGRLMLFAVLVGLILKVRQCTYYI